MIIKPFMTNTFTKTYPPKRVDIVMLRNIIESKLQSSGVKASVDLGNACGPWQGIAGENRVISIVERGLFFLFITVCYSQRNTQIQLCYNPQIRTWNYADSEHAMRCSQWDMCINTVLSIVEESIVAIAGEPMSHSEDAV